MKKVLSIMLAMLMLVLIKSMRLIVSENLINYNA